MANKKESLDKSLDTLNKYLYEGLLIKDKFMQMYKVEKTRNNEIGKIKGEYENSINKWFQEVAGYIKKHFELHLYFHFVQPKDDAMTNTHPLGSLNIALDRHLHALEEVIIRIEERRNLSIRQEIAEKEYEADVLYKITFSWHTREIKLNSMLLSRPNSDSKNLNFFEYVYAHQKETVDVVDIEEDTGTKMSDNIQDILRDLGFKGNIRKVFFPKATKSKILFINPITKQYAMKNDLPSIKLPK